MLSFKTTMQGLGPALFCLGQSLSVAFLCQLTVVVGGMVFGQ